MAEAVDQALKKALREEVVVEDIVDDSDDPGVHAAYVPDKKTTGMIAAPGDDDTDPRST